MLKKLLIIIPMSLIIVGAISWTVWFFVSTFTDTGFITKKTYEPPYTSTTYTCTGEKNTNCSPTTTYYPEKYFFNVENPDKGKSGWVYVDQWTYQHYKIGDWYGKDQ